MASSGYGQAWQALHDGLDDYGAAIQVVAHNPKTGQEEIGSQVTQAHLAGDAYPTSCLLKGEVVWDHVELAMTGGAKGLSIRTLSGENGRLYYRDQDGFVLPLWAGRVTALPGYADAEPGPSVTVKGGVR